MYDIIKDFRLALKLQFCVINIFFSIFNLLCSSKWYFIGNSKVMTCSFALKFVSTWIWCRSGLCMHMWAICEPSYMPSGSAGRALHIFKNCKIKTKIFVSFSSSHQHNIFKHFSFTFKCLEKQPNLRRQACYLWTCVRHFPKDGTFWIHDLVEKRRSKSSLFMLPHEHCLLSRVNILFTLMFFTLPTTRLNSHTHIKQIT